MPAHTARGVDRVSAADQHQEALSALLQVIMIDLTLAGDNAIVIGLAAAGLPRTQRNKAILHVSCAYRIATRRMRPTP